MLDFKAQGFFSWIVVNNFDKIVHHSAFKEPNLILNQGLDGVAERTWADSFTVCAVGIGSGGATPSQTGLLSEVKRTMLYLDMEDACSASLIEKDFVLKRTFVFSTEASEITYREAGFSHSPSAGGNLFSRIKLPNIVVGPGERLIIQYELLIRIEPATPKVLTAPITGLALGGSLQFQKIGLAGINSLGQSEIFDDGQLCNEPSAAGEGFLSTNSDSPATLGASINRGGTIYKKNLVINPYASGSYKRVKLLSLTRAEAHGDWRSCGVGPAGSSELNTGLILVFDDIFIKRKGILNLGFTYTWGAFSRANYTTLMYWLDDEKEFIKQNPLLQYFNLNE